jgi:hypothetical protein
MDDVSNELISGEISNLQIGEKEGHFSTQDCAGLEVGSFLRLSGFEDGEEFSSQKLLVTKIAENVTFQLSPEFKKQKFVKWQLSKNDISAK